MPENDERTTVDVSELTFGDGTIYVASVGSPKMNKITSEVQKNDHYRSPQGYSRLDEFYLHAAHLEANGEAGNSARIHLVRMGINADFQNFALKSYGEAPKPNTRRMYYALSRLSSFPVEFGTGVTAASINPESQLLIRLGYTDKQEQISFLKILTSRGQKSLRKGRAGSI